MAHHYVSCHTPDNRDPDRRIQGLGGFGWWFTIDQIIEMIGNGHTFSVLVAGRQVAVVVRSHGIIGRRYLTTEADGFPPNNLLHLALCR
ncbi:MAG: DUF3892 domain-containing protein [Novosphingobium sp.]|nr:DUF3892 domain-containing protein [Novosphingobium sp.]